MWQSTMEPPGSRDKNWKMNAKLMYSSLHKISKKLSQTASLVMMTLFILNIRQRAALFHGLQKKMKIQIPIQLAQYLIRYYDFVFFSQDRLLIKEIC